MEISLLGKGEDLEGDWTETWRGASSAVKKGEAKAGDVKGGKGSDPIFFRTV